MMRDPLDNGRTMEMNFDSKNFPEIVPEFAPEFKSTLTPEQIAAAMGEITSRSFFGRNPQLGKMVNCPVHGFRHREFEFGARCEQKFTYVVDGYEVFVDGPDDTLVPLLRTAIVPGEKPTIRQQVGQVQFKRKRKMPHFSKIKLQFIQRVRQVYEAFETKLTENLERVNDVDKEMPIVDVFEAQHSYFLHRARVIAARQLRKEREFADRAVRRRQDLSRRINRGLV